MVVFDTRQFLERHFDSPGNLVAVYSTVGTPPSVAAVEKWFQRGSIPGNQLALLIYVIETRDGCAVTLREFMREGGST